MKNKKINFLIIKKTNKMTKNSIYIITLMVLILGVVSCTFNNNETTNNEAKDTILETPKTKEEKIIEQATSAVEKGIDLIGEAVKNKKFNDSIKAANKKQIWACMIGLPFNNLEKLISAYEKVKNIESVTIFDDGNNNYLLLRVIRDEEIADVVKRDLKLLINQTALVNKDIELENMTTRCGKKELKEGMGKKLKKRYASLPCLICD